MFPSASALLVFPFEGSTELVWRLNISTMGIQQCDDCTKSKVNPSLGITIHCRTTYSGHTRLVTTILFGRTKSMKAIALKTISLGTSQGTQ
jgi:hypothetical protein